jgi:hypothetical protein
MGTWSVHPLGNDGALDLVAEVTYCVNTGRPAPHTKSCDPEDLLLRYLTEKPDTGYDHEIVAAGLVVAACKLRLSAFDMANLGVVYYGGDNPVALDHASIPITEELVAQAAKALKEVEKLDLGWRDPEDCRDWRENVRVIIDVLEGRSEEINCSRDAGTLEGRDERCRGNCSTT